MASPGFPSGLPPAPFCQPNKGTFALLCMWSLRNENYPVGLERPSLCLLSHSRSQYTVTLLSPFFQQHCYYLILLRDFCSGNGWNTNKTPWKITEKTANKMRGDVVESIVLNLLPSLTLIQVSPLYITQGQSKEYAYLSETKSTDSAISSLSLRMYFWDTVSFIYIWQIHSFLLRSMRVVST